MREGWLRFQPEDKELVTGESVGLADQIGRQRYFKQEDINWND